MIWKCHHYTGIWTEVQKKYCLRAVGVFTQLKYLWTDYGNCLQNWHEGVKSLDIGLSKVGVTYAEALLSALLWAECHFPNSDSQIELLSYHQTRTPTSRLWSPMKLRNVIGGWEKAKPYVIWKIAIQAAFWWVYYSFFSSLFPVLPTWDGIQQKVIDLLQKVGVGG